MEPDVERPIAQGDIPPQKLNSGICSSRRLPASSVAGLPAEAHRGGAQQGLPAEAHCGGAQAGLPAEARRGGA